MADERGFERIQALEIELGKCHEECEAAKERLSASLAERDLLLREIHHRVKNNLQVISSLISLQTRASNLPEVQNVFDDLQDRVRAIAALHESLYSSPDLQNILFGSYMEQLLRELFAFHSVDSRRISLTVDAADVVVEAEQALPLGLIVSELVSNSLKHAFAKDGPGEIAVSLQYLRSGAEQTLDDTQCELSVTDNGRGLTGVNKAPALGLRIVDLLVGDLKGSFHIDRDRPRGAKFTIRFPLEAESGTLQHKELYNPPPSIDTENTS